MKRPDPLYEIDLSLDPPSCLPSGIDMSSLIDVTQIQDRWKRYMDTKTKKLHICAEYYAKMQRELRTETGIAD